VSIFAEVCEPPELPHPPIDRASATHPAKPTPQTERVVVKLSDATHVLQPSASVHRPP
jgi:hypothetical protein